jgi:hypothetical protein
VYKKLKGRIIPQTIKDTLMYSDIEKEYGFNKIMMKVNVNRRNYQIRSKESAYHESI